jgi:hypothetical protein
MLNYTELKGKHKLIGAKVNILRDVLLEFFGIFYRIISSISSKLVQKIFNVVNNGIFYSKYHQFPKKVSTSMD